MRQRTWRRYLYLGNRLSARIPSLPRAQSEVLLDRLFEHIDQPHLRYRHRWSARELIFYDNRCCMQRRESFEADAERRLLASAVADSLVL